MIPIRHLLVVVLSGALISTAKSQDKNVTQALSRIIPESADAMDIPFLITIQDEKGKRIPGAIVVLKRLGPDGFTEEEIRKETKSVTNGNGQILLTYPGTFQTTEDGRRAFNIGGAVTVIDPDRAPLMIELSEYFPGGVYTEQHKIPIRLGPPLSGPGPGQVLKVEPLKTEQLTTVPHITVTMPPGSAKK